MMKKKTLVSQIPLFGFNIISYPRKNGRNQGMAIIHRELVKILVHEGNYKAMAMECSSYKIILAGDTLSLYAIYCIPSTSVLQLCDTLTKLLEQDVTDMCGKVLLVGNLKIHIDKKAALDTITFNDMLEGLNLRKT